MNHLRDWLDTPQQRLTCHPDFDAGEARSFADRTRALAESAVCFDVGDMSRLAGFTIVQELARLPFPTCWFESRLTLENGRTMLAGVMAHESSHEIADVAELYFWANLDGVWELRGAGLFPGRLNTKSQWRVMPPTQDAAREVRAIREFVAAFLCALNCANVRRREHVPPEKLQAARVRRGKKPLFSYWTLELLPSVEAVRLGGSHASPRLHLRRGHPRQYAPGKYCWVQPHVVGNKSLGMVHKDYRWAA